MERKLDASILFADSFEADEVPPGFEKSPAVAVVLPSAKYIDMMQSQESISFDYHLLTDPKYSPTDPISFDADKFVEESLVYCRKHKVQAVLGLDCFPSMLAAIMRQELKLPGPFSWSVFLCCNKYCMRREVTPVFGPISVAPLFPQVYPSVLKVSDTQFCFGTYICRTEGEWIVAWKDLKKGMLRDAKSVADRQQFYFKWGSRFKWPTSWKSPDDVVLAHSEPFIKSIGEYQAEVVLLETGKRLVQDTGDIIKSPVNHCVTVLRTPGTFDLTPVLKDYVDEVAGRLAALGYKSGIMDVKVMRVDAPTEAYQVVEINSRHAYMGNYIHCGLDDKARSSKKALELRRPDEVRNLVNRTRLALGCGPVARSRRSERVVARLACALYTDHCGSLDEVFDSEALAELIETDAVDGFTPAPVYLARQIVDVDLRQFNGWARIGTLLMTWEEGVVDIDQTIDQVVRKLFFENEKSYLPVRVAGPKEEPKAAAAAAAAAEKKRLSGTCVVS